MSAALLPTPNATSLGTVLAAIEAGASPSAALDARIHEAMGWLVMRATDGRMSMRSPQARQWLRMTTPSRDEADAFALIPTGWHHGLAVRDRPLAWCADPAAPTARFFECYGRSRPMAVTRAALHAQRALLTLPALPAASRAACRCGWQGPPDALRFGRCPDCARQEPLFITSEAHAHG